jgi:hypothetical protein
LKGRSIPDFGEAVLEDVSKHCLTSQIAATGDNVTVRRDEKGCPRIRAKVVCLPAALRDVLLN